jgi:hypothetical protein
MSPVQIYTAEQLAPMLGCSVKTVEQKAREGSLPGLLLGDGGWIFPAGALALRLDQMAIEEAEGRRKPALATATTSLAQASQSKRPLPKLVDLRG